MKKLLYLLVIAGCIASCNNPNANSSNSNAAKDKAAMQAFYDQVINKHNVNAVDSFTTANFVDHQANPKYPAGIAGVKADFTNWFTAMPDVNFKTNFMLATGDTVTAYFTITGTNSGPMMGMPATNKSVNADGIDIIRFENGKAAERWGFTDDVKIMKQLGVLPDMDKMSSDSTKAKMEDNKMEKKEEKKADKMETKKMDKKK